jgi:hypothetical protein
VIKIAGSCEYGNEISGTINGGEFRVLLRDNHVISYDNFSATKVKLTQPVQRLNASSLTTWKLQRTILLAKSCTLKFG